MTNESWQTLSQIAVALGLALAAFGGFSAYVFSQRIEREKTARGAYSGKLEAKSKTIFSAKDNIFPAVELADSGTIFVWKGPKEQPLIKLAGDTHLTVSLDENQVKVSVLIRD